MRGSPREAEGYGVGESLKWNRRGSVTRGLDEHASRIDLTLAGLCALTFELRGRSRDGTWPVKRMIRTSASRAKCHVGGGPAPVKG